MSNFYLQNRHLFEEVNEIPYAYQAERLYQLLPKLKYDSKLPRDIFREKQHDDYPSKNIFAQNARSLLGANFDNAKLYPQQNQPDRYSYPAQRDSYPAKKDFSPPKRDPFKRDIQPPQRDSQPFQQPNYPLPRESHQKKNELPSFDPFKRGFQPEPSKVGDQRSAGLSKAKYEEPHTSTRRRYPQQQASTSPFAVGDVNTEPSEIRRGGYPMQRGRIPSEFSPAQDNIPAAGRAAYGRVSSAFEGSSFLEHPDSLQEPVRNRGRKEPSYSPDQVRQQYGVYENYANPQLRQQGGVPSYFEENNKTLPPLRQIPEPVANKGGYEPIERFERPKRDQTRSESPKYYTMGTRGSPKKITQAINESIKQNIFPNHAYINVKKRVLNVRGDLSKLDEAPFPKDKTVLTATLQNRAQQLNTIGNKKTIQEALEYRILMTVPGDRKEKLKKLLQNEGSLPEGV